MLLKVLLFPFRALWFLLTHLLVPWYLRWLFGMPWWITGVFALIIARVAILEGSETIQARTALAEALAQGPPPVVALSKFDVLRDVSDYGEVRLSGTFRSEAAVKERQKPGPDLAFVPVFVGNTGEAGAVLVTLKIKADKLEALLAQADIDGKMIVHGSLSKVRSERKAIVASLRLAGFGVDDDIPLITPFLDGREKGLEAAVGYSPFFVTLLAVVAAVFGGLAVYRYRHRGRRKSATEVPRRVVSRPAVVPPPAIAMAPEGTVFGALGITIEKTGEAAVTPERLSEPMASQKQYPRVGAVPRPFVPRSPKALVDEAFGRTLGSPKNK